MFSTLVLEDHKPRPGTSGDVLLAHLLEHAVIESDTVCSVLAWPDSIVFGSVWLLLLFLCATRSRVISACEGTLLCVCFRCSWSVRAFASSIDDTFALTCVLYVVTAGRGLQCFRRSLCVVVYSAESQVLL